MNFLSIWSVPPLVSSILFLWIGLFVFSKNKKSKLNISFFAIGISNFIWQFTMFLLFNTINPAIANILVRVAHIGIIFLSVFIYHFAVNLLGANQLIDKIILRVNYVAAIVFEFLLFTDLFISGYYEYFWSFYPKAGILHPIFLLILTLTAVRLVYLLFVAYYSKSNISTGLHYQAKYILWAVLFYTFAASDFLLNYGIEFYPFGFIFILLFLATTSYAIVRHRLMDVKVVLRQSSVYAASFAIIVALAVFLNYFNDPDRQYYKAVNILIIVLLVAIFPYIKEYFYILANKYFFTSLYDSKKVISDLSYRLRSTLELDYVYESIYDSIDSSFHSVAFGFLGYEKLSGVYKFKYKKGQLPDDAGDFKCSSNMHLYYTKKNKIIIVDELDEFDDPETIASVAQFKKVGIEVLVPVNIKWRNIGLIALGKKETRDGYTKEDVELLEIIGGLGASAIDNSTLYKNISEQKNELENILAVKNDFMRIANHQLNTPLSIMRLAYSSVEEKSISMAEGFVMFKEGMNRLVDVISQLWTVVDLENRDLNLRAEKINLPEIYEDVIAIKRDMELFKSRGLKLNYSLSEGANTYFVKANKQKIREIFSGLLDNAIFYTKAGEVSVSLDKVKSEAGDYIKTTISDTGVGISPEDQKHIFEKFSRGKNAALLHPDGSGIGLFIAKRIVEASGGVFLLEKTSAESGSVFSFTLPAEE